MSGSFCTVACEGTLGGSTTVRDERRRHERHR